MSSQHTFKYNLIEFVKYQATRGNWFTELQYEVEWERNTILLRQLTEVSTVEAANIMRV